MFIKKKEKEYEENKKRAEERNTNMKKRQQEMKLKMHKSLEELKEKIDYKEKAAEIVLIRLSEKKEKKILEEKIKQKKKKDNVINNLIKAQEIKEKNRKLYFDKQLHMEQTVFLKNLEIKERNKAQFNKLNSKHSLTLENKKHLETENLKKKATTLRRIQLIDERVKDNQKKK